MGIFAKRNVFVMMKGPEISCARNHYQLENYIIIDFQPHCSLHFYWKGAKCNDHCEVRGIISSGKEIQSDF